MFLMHIISRRSSSNGSYGVHREEATASAHFERSNSMTESDFDEHTASLPSQYFNVTAGANASVW